MLEPGGETLNAGLQEFVLYPESNAELLAAQRYHMYLL